MTDQPSIAVRHPKNDDMRFVRDSWFKSYREGGLAPEVPFHVYQVGMNSLINAILGHPSDVLIAASTAVPDEILGWACCRPPFLHYVYVKQAYRRLGIATGLVRQFAALKEYTLATKRGRMFAKKLGLGYNPFPLFLQ